MRKLLNAIYLRCHNHLRALQAGSGRLVSFTLTALYPSIIQQLITTQSMAKLIKKQLDIVANQLSVIGNLLLICFTKAGATPTFIVVYHRLLLLLDVLLFDYLTILSKRSRKYYFFIQFFVYFFIFLFLFLYDVINIS